MKKVYVPILVIISSWSLMWSQEKRQITLDECFELAITNHPLQHQLAIHDNRLEVKREIIARSRYPDITWTSVAQFQSAVPDIPFAFPESFGDPVDLPLYNIKTSVESKYVIHDAGVRELEKEEAILRNSVVKQEVLVSLESLRNEVSDHYFTILLLRRRIQIIDRSIEIIEVQRDRLSAALEFGTALQSDVTQLNIELANLESQSKDLKFVEQKRIRLLSGLISTPLSSDIHLEHTGKEEFSPQLSIQRPELVLFSNQKDLLLKKTDFLDAAAKPTLAAYTQLGIGYPNPLNFFEDKVSPFFLLGLQMNWTIVDWKKKQYKKDELLMQSQLIDNQRETFIFDINRREEYFLNDIEKYLVLIEADREIVDLHQNIIESFQAQLDEGVITTSDFLIQLNKKIAAEIRLETKQIQLEQTKTNYLIFKGIQ